MKTIVGFELIDIEVYGKYCDFEGVITLSDGEVHFVKHVCWPAPFTKIMLIEKAYRKKLNREIIYLEIVEMKGEIFVRTRDEKGKILANAPTGIFLKDIDENGSCSLLEMRAEKTCS